MNSECDTSKSCSNHKCVNPCLNACGQNAECRVVNHAPICSCRQGFGGDPFIRCLSIPIVSDVTESNPCIPSPCGPNALCQITNKLPTCTCLNNYIGSPPNCHAECTVNSDCASSLACMNQRCRDPCPGSCGLQAVCQVYQHSAVCSCKEGYTGDPFRNCHIKENIGSFMYIVQIIFIRTYVNYVVIYIYILLLILEPLPPTYDECNPSPCGANADCNRGRCTCKPNYFGNPYISCRPECTTNADCPQNKACINTRCTDPCNNICGTNAICDVYNHIPMCSCPSNMTGNAFFACNPITRKCSIFLIFKYTCYCFMKH